MRKNRKIKKITTLIFILPLSLIVSYAAFETNINLKAKGNIKENKELIDKQIPQDKLLFWADVDGVENTKTLLKDKSINQKDGTIYGATYEKNALLLDGVDDYVDIGYAGYDFKNTISYVIYVKLYQNSHSCIFGNWESAGSGLWQNPTISFDIYDTVLNEYVEATSPINIDTNTYYTVIGIQDENIIKLYIDGKLMATQNVTNMNVSSRNVIIGGNPNGDVIGDTSNMSFKEAMLYDRALTEEEVSIITKAFHQKYE